MRFVGLLHFHALTPFVTQGKNRIEIVWKMCADGRSYTFLVQRGVAAR